MYLRTINYLEDNTVGSQLTKEERAYIAGFLDGDGSLMLQMKKRGDSKRGWRFMATICLYQDSRHDSPLTWMKRKLGIGYLSHRNDGITELRINGFKQVRDILALLIPYIRFKKAQAHAIHRACTILVQTSLNALTRTDKKCICQCLMEVQENNYMTHRKKTIRELYSLLGLTP